MTDSTILAEEIAKAVFASVSPDEDWLKLTDEERSAFLLIAHAAAAAHDAWLKAEGFNIVPAGCVQVPSCDAEAGALLKAVEAYRQAQEHKAMFAAPKLILPPTMQ